MGADDDRRVGSTQPHCAITGDEQRVRTHARTRPRTAGVHASASVRAEADARRDGGWIDPRGSACAACACQGTEVRVHVLNARTGTTRDLLKPLTRAQTIAGPFVKLPPSIAVELAPSQLSSTRAYTDRKSVS